MTLARRPIAVPALIFAVTVLAYITSFKGVFMFDDSKTIEDNGRVRHLLPATKHEWLSPRSFADTTFAVNYRTGGLNPVDYHLTNVLIHAMTAVLLYAVLRRTLALNETMTEKPATWLAAAAATLWALHPLNSSCITYITQRYEALMAMFALLALYALIRAAGDHALRRWKCLVILAYFLALGSKEGVIVFPFLMFIYDALFLAPSLRDLWRQRCGLYLTLLLASFLPVLASLVPTDSTAWIRDAYYGGDPSLTYLLTQAGVIIHYLRLTLWPHPLCIDYAWPLVGHWSETLPHTLLLGILLGLTLLGFRRHPLIAFAGLWFFATLAPTSSIMPRPDCAFEYRMYLPLMALAALVPPALYRIALRITDTTRHPHRVTALCLLILLPICAALGAATALRNIDYHDAQIMWRQVIKLRPGNIRPYHSLIAALIRDERFNEAVEVCDAALAHLPDFRAMEHATILATAEANPKSIILNQAFDYSGLKNNRGIAHRHLRDLPTARVDLEEACRVAPGNRRARLNLATVYYGMGEEDRAIQMLKSICDENPHDPYPQQSLADMYFFMGYPKSSVMYYENTLRLAPDNIMAQTRLAWIKATTADADLVEPERAVRMGEVLLKASLGQSANAHDILAAAAARLNRFDEAIRYGTAAIQLAESAERPAMEARLELYRQGKPYIAPAMTTPTTPPPSPEQSPSSQTVPEPTPAPVPPSPPALLDAPGTSEAALPAQP